MNFLDSLWNESTILPSFEKLKKDEKTDVLIIGGGMAGLLCARLLCDAGIDCIVAEAEKIASGVTRHTTAKITAQHGLIYAEMLEKSGMETARAYLAANESAIREYKKMCKNTACDFEEKDSFVYSKNDREKIANEIRALNSMGFPAEAVKKIPIPVKVAGAVRFPCQAQFNPLKFISSISGDLRIFENTKIIKIKKTTAFTDRGTIEAKKIIVATHFPFINSHGSYFLKMYQERSFVIALEGAPDVHGMYIDGEQGGLSFRNYDGLLLLGGGSRRTGKEGCGWDMLSDFAHANYPKSKIKYSFATQDCMTLDGIPYIGKYSAFTDNLYVATGFNKWGMTSSMLSAMILRDIIIGKDNKYAKVFSPSRSIFHRKLAANIFESGRNLLTFSKTRCTHLGCALKFNSAEHTWDCPCHGSRFTEEGKIIDNPATKDLHMDNNTKSSG